MLQTLTLPNAHVPRHDLQSAILSRQNLLLKKFLAQDCDSRSCKRNRNISCNIDMMVRQPDTKCNIFSNSPLVHF